jgi:2'-5' RNA ligase
MSPAVRQAAAGLAEEFAAVASDVKWVEPENMHLTLKFLGDVENTEIHRVCQLAAEAVADEAPFRLQMYGAGAFPNVRRPRTIWIGAGDGSDATARLAKNLDKAMKKLGYRPEGRVFAPHLTLGRVRRSGPWLAPLAELIQQYAERDLGHTTVEEVIVFSSELGREGATYDALARCPLGT